jgi:hypothetical protein
MLNLIKKLEEKENTISKLSYKLDKLEKEIGYSNIILNIDEEIKNKNSKINYYIKNNNDEYTMNNNGYLISIRKDTGKNQKNVKSEESNIPLEKFNGLLEKLNQVEEKFEKLQKENIELRKNQKIFSNENNNNQITNENKSECIIINNNDDHNIKKIEENLDKTNKSYESDYFYKNKYNELEMKLKILKEACQNILQRLTIPKKDKEEIKQILKLFDFSEEEILNIIGDKKK